MAETLKVDFQKKNGILLGSPKIIKMVRDKFSIQNPSYQGRRFAPRLYSITPSGAFQVGLWNEIENYIRSLNLPLSIFLTDEFKNQYSPDTKIETISKIDNFNYYDYQEDSISQLIKNGRGIAMIATGGGKCFGKGVEIMLYSGETKKVENLEEGDILVGPDCEPRKIISLTRGEDFLYKITGPNTKEFVVNSEHILSFRTDDKENNSLNFSVKEYVDLPESYKEYLYSWKPGVVKINDDVIILDEHKNFVLSKISVSKIGWGEYYGFEVVGNDNLFLLSDYTVTHNSLIQAGLVKTFLDNYPDYKILMTVPNVSLLNQLYYSFMDEYNIQNISRWGDGKTPDLSKNVLLANNQILISDIPGTLEIVQDFDVVIVDEVHTINEKKNKISKVIHNIKTPFKYGLTGTLPDSILGAWNVLGKIGPIVYERNSYELRKQETITDVEIKIVLCKHSQKPVFVKNPNAPTDAYNTEIDFVINNKDRNAAIAKIGNSLNGNVLIVVDRLNYIDTLKNALENSDKKILVVTGDTSTDDRTAIQELMDRETGIICIAMSKCFSTGISIKNLHYAIFAYMGKGGVKTVQTIGRTVRKHISKSKAIIFDIADDLPYSSRHLKERMKIYQEQKINYKITKIQL